MILKMPFPWSDENRPPNVFLEVDDNDIPEMLINLLRSHIHALQKSGGTGYRHVYYHGDNKKGYKMRGYSAYLSITGPNSHRIALTNNLMAAVIMIAAAKIDPRLLSQKSASRWFLWMLSHPGGTRAAIKEWLADETVQQNMGEISSTRSHGERPSRKRPNSPKSRKRPDSPKSRKRPSSPKSPPKRKLKKEWIKRYLSDDKKTHSTQSIPPFLQRIQKKHLDQKRALHEEFYGVD